MATTTTTTTASSNWFRSAITITVAVISLTTAAISVFAFRKKSRDLTAKIKELEISLQSSLEKCAAERKGRIRAQQEVRKVLTNDNTQQSKQTSYPMAPIGVVQSCFATRYGAPRQPLVVPIARACLVFDTSQVPPAALEGFAEYSHCWIIYVFHLNTDLEKMWKQPSQSKFKAKVRVPRLKGGRMGVFATRSPHRPCPIGLTVAKVEGVQGNMVLLSGVDLVDGTPVLDIKPYLPYCESIPEALMPEWVTEDNNFSVASINFSHEFSSTLGKCWMTAEEKSLYASPDEIQSLIKQVLQWDIRSLSQRNQPHSLLPNPNYATEDHIPNSEDDREGDVPSPENRQGPLPSPDAVIYHLMVDVLDVSYRIDDDGNVVVGKVTLNPDCQKRTQHQYNYTTWKDVVG